MTRWTRNRIIFWIAYVASAALLAFFLIEIILNGGQRP